MSLPARLHDEAVSGKRPRRRAALAAALCLLAAAADGPHGHAQGPAIEASPAVLRIGITRADGSVTPEAFALDEYVARVLAGEGQPKAAPAAQEALAIVIRTFALANRNRHRAEGYDLCDTTHCQVMRPVHPAARAAALATAGRVLLDRGRPAFVFYSAHNGGTPALASEIWPGAIDYAPGEPHDACDQVPGWIAELTSAEAEKVLRAAGLAGRRLRRLTIADRTPSGRAGRMRAEGFSPETITAYEFRMAAGRTLGWQRVRSTAFTLTASDGGYRLEGVGYGHGVGLCVVGAGLRAARGEDVATILRAYFRDLAISGTPALTTTRIAPAPPPAVATPAPPSVPAPEAVAPAAPVLAADVRLLLPAGNEAERARLLEVARQTRDEVAARALVPAPPVITIQVHPTMEAFGRATGQPWWGTGATVGTAIDLAPIDQLQRRGQLESALRYEVASAVVTPALPRAPAWARVGAALYFSAPPAGPPGAEPRGRLRCPSEEDLLRPASDGARREAMARAERCVRREIARGRRLTELR
jgi:SpoIID/LytB domain protein